MTEPSTSTAGRRARVAPRSARVRFAGRILFLYDDAEAIRAQIEGHDLAWDPERPLIDNISTDEITPGWVCFHFDDTLGEYALVGLRGGTIGHRDLQRGGFSVIVAGRSKGCGSSREQAPFAEMAAGIGLVVARSVEKIYAQNAQNIGLLTSSDFGLIDRIRRGEDIPLAEFTQGLDVLSRDIVRYGGLFSYNRARLSAEVSVETPSGAARPMTLSEKVIAGAVVRDAATGALGVTSVSPGESCFVRTGIRFSHDYTTAMSEAIFVRALGPDARVADQQSTFAFRDHLTFLGQVMPDAHRKMGLLEKAGALATVQQAFCERQGVRLYGETGQGSEAICHNAVLEDLAMPGDIVLGTDSHTCTAGAVGAFAFGVGSTDMANAWLTRDVRVRVPETVRVELRGRRRAGVVAKDVMLAVLALDYIREGRAIGQVLEFGGPGVSGLSMDERATLTNMAVEAGAFTGIVEADETTLAWLVANRPAPRDVDSLRVTLGDRLVRPDADACYVARLEIDLDTLEPMVATPGDPRNGVPISQLGERVKIDIAYGGSCTGGKRTDMDMYASVIGQAARDGRRVAEGVELYIQFGSQKIKAYAGARGYLDLFREVGAQVIDPSCGACIAAGPGVSRAPDQVTVSAINRNFPGRSGPGKVYLASPLVVAASAIAGYLIHPDDM